MVELSRTAREQLIQLRRAPQERPYTNTLLGVLARDGLVVGRPLMRPSGKPSRYREWTITDRGIEALAVQA